MISVINLEVGQTYTVSMDDLKNKEYDFRLFDFSLKRDYMIKSLQTEKEKNPFEDYENVSINFCPYIIPHITQFNKYKIDINNTKFTIIDKQETDCKLYRTTISFMSEKNIKNIEIVNLLFSKFCFAKTVVNDSNKNIPFFLFEQYNIALSLYFSLNKQYLDFCRYTENIVSSPINEKIKNSVILLAKEYLTIFNENDYEKKYTAIFNKVDNDAYVIDFNKVDITYVIDVVSKSNLCNKLNNNSKIILRQIANQMNEIIEPEKEHLNRKWCLPFVKCN